MLVFFRTNQLIFNFLLIIYALLLRSSVLFLKPEIIGVQPGILTKDVYTLFPVDSLWSFLLSTFLVFIQAVMLNVLVGEYRLEKDISLLPGLSYILLTSCYSEFLYLSPCLVGNTFFILSFFSLFSIYKRHHASTSIFNVGFFGGLAALCFPAYSYILLLGLIGIGVLKSLSLNDLLSILFGFIATYILVGTYYFVLDDFSVLWNMQLVDWLGFFSLSSDISSVGIWKTVGFFLVAVALLFGYGSYVRKKDIQKQKYINIFYWTFFCSLLGLLFQQDLHLEYVLVFTIPLAVLMAFFLSSLKPAVAEAIHFLVLVGVLIMQFSTWMF